MLDQITPIVLTYNEAPNIGRTLKRLTWARMIVVVDSASTDETSQIVAGFPTTRIYQNKFHNFASQLNYALNETGITSEWVMALDADHNLSEELIREMEALHPNEGVAGYRARFTYVIHGQPLRACLYPPRVVLFRRGLGRYLEDGHSQKLLIEGKIDDLKSMVLHDDRKSFPRWFASQEQYAELETEKLMKAHFDTLSWPDKIRKTKILAPMGILLYCLFIKGLVLDGWRGIYYSFQRMLAELLLSLRLIERDLQK